VTHFNTSESFHAQHLFKLSIVHIPNSQLYRRFVSFDFVSFDCISFDANYHIIKPNICNLEAATLLQNLNKMGSISLFNYTPSIPGVLTIILSALFFVRCTAAEEIFDINDSRSTKSQSALGNSSWARCQHAYGKLTSKEISRCMYVIKKVLVK
jgi:hypothetical protein